MYIYMAIVRKIEVGVLSWQSSFTGEIQWMCTKLYAMGSMAGSGSNKQADMVRSGVLKPKPKLKGFGGVVISINREKACPLGDPHVTQVHVYGKRVIVCAKSCVCKVLDRG